MEGTLYDHHHHNLKDLFCVHEFKFKYIFCSYKKKTIKFSPYLIFLIFLGPTKLSYINFLISAKIKFVYYS
jgi:hypothetical protein